MSAGAIGLMRAVDRFDFTKNVNFVTYAQYLGGPRDPSRDRVRRRAAARRPVAKLDAARLLRPRARRPRAGQGDRRRRRPVAGASADRGGRPRQPHRKRSLSLDATPETGGPSYVERLEGEDRVESSVIDKMETARIRELVAQARLTDRERLTSYQAPNVGQPGQAQRTRGDLGLSRERIRQLEKIIGDENAHGAAQELADRTGRMTAREPLCGRSPRHAGFPADHERDGGRDGDAAEGDEAQLVENGWRRLRRVLRRGSARPVHRECRVGHRRVWGRRSARRAGGVLDRGGSCRGCDPGDEFRPLYVHECDDTQMPTVWPL